MKNKLMNVGVLAIGLSVALVFSPLIAAASEDDSIVDVNVLSKEDEKSSVLDVEILDVPVVGDVDVNIPSEADTGATEALATVEVSDGVVDDLDVSVLDRNESKASVATVEMESPMTNEVTVDVISGEKTAGSFRDVQENHGAYMAIETIKQEGIMAGYGDGRFGPNDSITRAQMAAVIYRLDQKGWNKK